MKKATSTSTGRSASASACWPVPTAAIQVGHVVIDLHLPSFRYAITDKSSVQVHLLDWLFGVSIGYAF